MNEHHHNPPDEAERWRLVREIFEAALELDQAKRLPWLSSACKSDPALLTRVSRMLQAHEQEGLLDAPVINDQVAPQLQAVSLEIGSYRLLREIGRGGMGIVYLAQRDDGLFDHDVAVKLVFPSFETAEVTGRFDRERRVLARLNHPNIARLIDGGTTDAGWPYLVMEYVEGQPIDVYCDAHRLTITDRLKLFQQVCAAVEHAHQHLIIHRDLKPPNILVTADGMPRLLDFGIAKILDPGVGSRPGRESKSVYLTRSALHFLTPEYSSPEQLRSEEITAASDVYSLGVLLYELLTGHRPYRLKSPLLHDVLEAVTHTEPQLPSAAIDRVVTETDVEGNVRPKRSPEIVSRTRETSADKLRRRLKGDLDNILLKALAKTPAQRYQSVTELSEDINRHLRGEPVTARKPTLTYRSGRFIRRHHTLAAVAVTICAALLLGLIALFWRWQSAKAEARRNRPHVYAAQMRSASDRWEEKKVTQLQTILDQWRPHAGEQDLRGFEWYYLQRLNNRALMTLPQSGWIEQVRFLPDGKSVVILEGNGNPSAVKVVDLMSRQVRTITVGNNKAVLFYDKYLVTSKVLDDAGKEWLAGLFDLTTGEQMCRLTVRPRLTPDNLRLMMASADGKLFTVQTDDKQVTVFDVATSQPVVTINDDRRIEGIAHSLSGKEIFTYGRDHSRKVWEIRTGRRSNKALPVVTFSNRGQVSPDRRRLYFHHYALNRGTLVNPVTGQIIRNKMAHRDVILSNAFSPDSKLLATASADRTVKLWDAMTGRELRTLRGHTDWCYEAAFSPDSKMLATCSSDFTIRLWDVASGRALAVIQGHPGEVHTVAFSPDGKWLASGGDDRLLKVWDVRQCMEPTILRDDENKIFSVAVAADSTQVAAADDHGQLKLWNAQTGEVKTMRAHTREAFATAFSPDGKIVATGGHDQVVKLWDASSGKLLRDFMTHDDAIRTVTFSPDGRWLATGSDGWQVKLWDVASGFEIPTLYLGFGVHALAFSPDGKVFASGGEGRNGNDIHLCDVATKKVTGKLIGHTDPIRAIKFSPDGKIIATASRDHTIKLWDAKTLREIRMITGHSDEIFSISFSPDGRRLASASNDKTVRIWDVATGEELLRLKDHTEQVWSVAFSPDGRMLVSGSWDGTVRIWRAAPDEVNTRPHH